MFLLSETRQQSMEFLNILVNKSKEDTNNLTERHRRVHSDISQVGKAIDKVCI